MYGTALSHLSVVTLQSESSLASKSFTSNDLTRTKHDCLTCRQAFCMCAKSLLVKDLLAMLDSPYKVSMDKCERAVRYVRANNGRMS